MIQITIVALVIVMAICLAAISTLYFVEHGKQIDRHYLRRYESGDFFSDRNYLANSSNYESNAMIGGEGFSGRHNNKADLSHSLRKGSLKTTHHNTQNISNAQQQHQQQQSALSIVEIAPLNVGSYSNGNTNDARADADDGLKTIETSQNSTSDEEASHNHEINLESEIQKNNGTNDIITIPTKLALNKHNNDATTTTEKLQLKAEKIVDNYAVVVAEPHESNNAIGDNIFSDVDTNFIDVGHQAPRNSSSNKTSEKNNTENHGDVENRHPLHLSPSVYESEFHRERTIRFPIGLPAHCVGVNVSKLGQTPLDSQHSTCPLFCGHEIGKTLVPEVSETLEMAIPENVDVVESSTSFKLQKNALTSTERKLDNSVVSSTTLNENSNHHPLSEQTTAKSKLDENIHDDLENVEKINSDVNKIPIQVEEPLETRETFKIPPKPFLLPPANHSDRTEPVHSTGRASGLSDIPKIKSNKAKEPHEASTDAKKQELEPLLLAVDGVNSTKFLENDIKSTFIKKTELSRFDILKPTNANVELSTSDATASSSTAPTTLATPATTTTKHGIAIEPTKSSCVTIYVVLRSESFNITLGSDEICHNFNITYNIPLSKYMKEDRFDLIFITQSSLHWTLCSVKEGTGKGSHNHLDSHNITDKTSFYKKGIAFHASFEINIPAFGDFERQMEFQANLQPSDSIACRLPALFTRTPMQTILYKINIYRDCAQ